MRNDHRGYRSGDKEETPRLQAAAAAAAGFRTNVRHSTSFSRSWDWPPASTCSLLPGFLLGRPEQRFTKVDAESDERPPPQSSGLRDFFIVCRAQVCVDTLQMTLLYFTPRSSSTTRFQDLSRTLQNYISSLMSLIHFSYSIDRKN